MATGPKGGVKGTNIQEVALKLANTSPKVWEGMFTDKGDMLLKMTEGAAWLAANRLLGSGWVLKHPIHVPKKPKKIVTYKGDESVHKTMAGTFVQSKTKPVSMKQD